MAKYRCIRDCWSSALRTHFIAGQEWEFDDDDDFPRKHFINLDKGEEMIVEENQIELDHALERKTLKFLKAKYPESDKKIDWRAKGAKKSPKRTLILQIMKDEGIIKETPKGLTMAEHMIKERNAKLGMTELPHG